MEVLKSYSFLIVAIGTLLLAISTGMIGCISVLKGQSLIGDAIGHSSYPGIILAFIIVLSKSPIFLLIGAIISGSIAFFCINLISKNSKMNFDSTLAIILSSFFGFGMVLKTYIQGNVKFQRASQSGLQNYIFGQASYILKSDIYTIFIVSIISLSLLLLFYKEIKLYVFDDVYARTIGINTQLINTIILIATMLLIATGLKLVGTILISSMLIIPSITALQWSNKLSIVLILSAIVGGVSAIIGTYISTAYRGMSTGATIILIMGLMALFSLLFGRRGFFVNLIKRRNFK